GSTFEDKLEGRMRVSIVATGIDAGEAKATTRTTSGVKVTAVARQPQAAPAQPVMPHVQPSAIHAATQAARQAIPPRAYAAQMPAVSTVAVPKQVDEPEAVQLAQREF